MKAPLQSDTHCHVAPNLSGSEFRQTEENEEQFSDNLLVTVEILNLQKN